MSYATLKTLAVQGQVSRGFEVVRDAFAESFAWRHALGGACCVYVRGEKVVDLAALEDEPSP